MTQIRNRRSPAMDRSTRLRRPSPGSSSFCGRTRREFLWEIGGGFGSVALTGLLGGDGFLARQAVAADGVDAVRQPDGAQGPAAAGEGQERDLPVHVRRARATSTRSTTSPSSTRSTARRSPSRRSAAAARRTRGGSSGPSGRSASTASAASGSPTCSRTWRRASTTSRSCTRCTPSRRSTARPC